MASLRDVVRDYQDELRNGIAWVVFWREGRSWAGEYIYLDAASDNIEYDDMGRLESIKAKDPGAVALNGYYCGRLGEDMTPDELAKGVRWHYESGFNLLSGFMEEHSPYLPPELVEETRKIAHAAGLPFSERPYTGEDFDPYVFDGSMSIEDYDLMHKMINDERRDNLADKKSPLQQYTDMLEQGTREIFESGRFEEYLQTMSRFHNYSSRNVMLIQLQMPGATRVAGYNKWRDDFERQVLKGQKAIKIFAPTPYKVKEERTKTDPDTGRPIMGADGKPQTEEVEVTKPHFKLVNVFDVSQTDGKPLPHLAENFEGDVQYFEIFRQALEQSTDRPVTYEPMREGLNGFVLIEDGTIHIKDDLSEGQTAAVLIHEMAHAELEHDEIPEEESLEEKDARRRREEVEAEGVAFVVSQYFGIDTSAYSFGYVAAWGRDQELDVLKASLATIQKTAKEMINRIDEKFTELKQEHGIEQTIIEPEAVRVVPSQDAAIAFATDYHTFMTSHNLAVGVPPFSLDEPDVAIAETAQRIVSGNGVAGINDIILNALNDMDGLAAENPEMAENLTKMGETLLRRLTGFVKVEYIMPELEEGTRASTIDIEPEVQDNTTEQATPEVPDTPERFVKDYASLLGEYNHGGGYYPDLGSDGESFAMAQLQYGIKVLLQDDLDAIAQTPDFTERAFALSDRLADLSLDDLQAAGITERETAETFAVDFAYAVRSFHDEHPDEMPIVTEASIAQQITSGNYADIRNMIEQMAANRPYSNVANTLNKRFAMAQAEQRIQEQAAPELTPVEQFGVAYNTFMHERSTQPQPENWLEENMAGFEDSFMTGYNGQIRFVLEAWMDDPQHGEQAKALLAQLDDVEHELWPEPAPAPMRDRRAQFGIDVAQIMESYYSENPAPSETDQMAHTSPSLIAHQVEVGHMPYLEHSLALLESNEQFSQYADQFRERLATLEPLQASEFDIGYGHMGNGLSVYNRLELVDGDYARVAHIQPDRTVTFYHNNLPQEIREQIEHEARTSEMTVSATQDTPVFSTPPQPAPEVDQAAPVPEDAERLAHDLNQFYLDFDQYGYQDEIDDPIQYVAELERHIDNGGGDFDRITTELAEIGKEFPEYAPDTNALLLRLAAFAELNHQPQAERDAAVGLSGLTLDEKIDRVAQRFDDLMGDLQMYDRGRAGLGYRPETAFDREFSAEEIKGIKADIQDGKAQQYIDILESAKTAEGRSIVQQARCELLIKQFTSVAAELQGLQAQQEATTPEREQPDRTRGVPMPELGEQVADTTITPEQREQFDTITDGTLLPLNKDRAVELFQQDQPVYLVDSKGETMMVLDEQEIIQGVGMFAIDAEDWRGFLADAPAPAVEQATEQAQDAPLLPGEGDRYAIYQIENTRDVDYAWRRLPNKEALQYEHYKQMYTAPLEPGVTLDHLWDRHNRDDRPAGQTMRSLSMSDVIVTVRDGKEQAFYVDDAFTEVPQFLEQAKAAEAQPETYRYYSTQRPVGIGTYPTGQIVNFENFDTRQPVEGGAFQAWGYLEYRQPLTEQQMKDYELRPAVQESHIKAAEMSTEDNYNMIDGIPNNTSPEPEPEKEPVIVEVRAAVISNYEGMDAFVGADDKVYLGQRDNYDNHGHYNNADDSLLLVSDDPKIFGLLYGEGLVISQEEALRQHVYTQETLAEFAALQAGLLSQFKQVKEFRFDGQPFVPPPTMAELEADAAAGKQVSLMDMVAAIKAEKPEKPAGTTGKKKSLLGELKKNQEQVEQTPRDDKPQQDRKNEREV